MRYLVVFLEHRNDFVRSEGGIDTLPREIIEVLQVFVPNEATINGKNGTLLQSGWPKLH